MTSIIIVTVIVGTLLVATCAYFLWTWTSKSSGMFVCFKNLDFNTLLNYSCSLFLMANLI